jgi:ABC-type branched-subunit amino acid transport system permease subunit
VPRDGVGLRTIALLLAAAAAAGLILPAWLVSLATIALSSGLVVLGLVVLWRAGLVPFGQALYFASGAYGVALLARFGGVTDAFLLLGVGGIAGALVAFVVGFLLARYREIFFAMLSLALSMILYGVLAKTASLGSTDGFNVPGATFAGWEPVKVSRQLVLYWFATATAAGGILIVATYLRSVAGSLAIPIRDNEIRVEYLGLSVTRLIHLKIVLSGGLAGAGGAIAALAIGHVDPNMSYWTTSGGFVFVTILSGAGSVVTPFLGAFLFELVRSLALSVAPTAWQFILGGALLLTIVFLPGGLASVRWRVRLPRAGRSA